ncbi:small integral membrane protein 30-like [Astyanax mexicanus]|uniref:Putative transmembrane protein n=1 Tax=Astyanax mexicanus TaxID=7994 RepID=A0A8T2MB39_ASTMX|nr:small integral membrane protein 30-like [Astyanax mexicanus]KAG9280354.1 putative transmembrane protein [Astyanax mexicanus]
MASCRRSPGLLAVLCLLLSALIPAAEAFDGGDAVALLLGMTVTVVGFCACLGWYARRRNGQF